MCFITTSSQIQRKSSYIFKRFYKYLHFKMFGVFPIRHCKQNTLLEEVHKSSLKSRRKVAFVVFLQKLIFGKIVSSTLLSELNINIPRVKWGCPVPFCCNILSTLPHFNCANIVSFKLCNFIFTNSHLDIFHDNCLICYYLCTLAFVIFALFVVVKWCDVMFP